MYRMAIQGPYSVRYQAAKFWLAARAGWRDTDRAEPLLAMTAAVGPQRRGVAPALRCQQIRPGRPKQGCSVSDDGATAMNDHGRARIWFAMLAAERERRRLLTSRCRPPRRRRTSTRSNRWRRGCWGSPRPGDGAAATELVALARERDDAGLEAVRLKYDLAPAEVVAWLIAAGDGEAALEALGRYAALMPAAS